MKEYTVTIAGVEHTMLLDDDDAKRMAGNELTEVGTKASAPANKSRASTTKTKD